MRERSALEQHPELAQLWTLHYGGRIALKSLEYTRMVDAPLLVRPALSELRGSIERLLVAVERYKEVVQLERAEELRVHIPESWSAEQVDALLNLLGNFAYKVRHKHQTKRSRTAGLS